MPKKKGKNPPKNARQSKREKKLAEKEDATPTPEKDVAKGVAVTAEQTKADVPVERKRSGRKPMTEE